MIRLHRPRAPRIFASAAVKDLRRKIEEFFGQKRQPNVALYEWPGYSRLVSQPVRPVLRRMSGGKCAYCERQFGKGVSMTVDSFRPRTRAIGSNGSVSTMHYWWLATEWTNLIPSCVQCNRAKGSRFPIEGRRARQKTRPSEIHEQALLIDPCQLDPAEHLVFTGDGAVSGATPQGRATIEVLALNRRDLVIARRHYLDRLRNLIDRLRRQMDAKPQSVVTYRNVAHLVQMMRPTAPFVMAARQQVARLLDERPRDALLASMLSAEPELRRVRKRLKAQEGIVEESDKREAKKLDHSVDSGTASGKAAYFGGQRRIERIVIQNFKSIRHLTIDVPETGLSESGLMLVGENGTGKSSILQAITLALIGPGPLKSLALDASTFVREGAKSGIVEISLSNVAAPVRLTFRTDRRRFTLKPRKTLVLLQAYGSTRLLPNTHRHEPLKTRYVRGRNLFNAYARLQHAEKWLADPKKVTDVKFRDVTETLKKLLMWDGAATISRVKNKVVVSRRGHDASLWQLSDGYQSVLSLVVDIMIAMAKWPSPDLAEGVVVIDEIEAHLHPVWKMKIVDLLRRVFPRVCFIFTTHDPLCVRGMRPKEIIVIKSRGTSTETFVVEESLDYLRADQLLTSPLFGLGFTRAPIVDQKLRRYDELAAIRKRSKKAEHELHTLRAELAGMLDAGESPVQRLAYRIAELAINGDISLSELEKMLPKDATGATEVSPFSLNLVVPKSAQPKVP